MFTVNQKVFGKVAGSFIFLGIQGHTSEGVAIAILAEVNPATGQQAKRKIKLPVDCLRA